ncbi:MAG: globin [Actinomycetes bacterium]
MTDRTFYEKVGGHETFVAIVDGFYQQLEVEPLLLAMYPKKDMAGAKERLMLFLEQYWGGPTTYSDQRGHPRLRMRHVGFKIGEPEKQAWLRCAHAAIIDLPIAEALKEELWSYFQYAAHSMLNQSE